jgi:hypothetical protein
MRRLFPWLLVLAIAGCVTPSIPIPPPAPERMTFSVDLTAGTTTFAYPPDSNYADAIVYVFNRSVGQGVITTARADGSVAQTPPFPAQYGDEVAVTIEAQAQAVSTCVVLHPTGATETCNF